MSPQKILTTVMMHIAVDKMTMDYADYEISSNCGKNNYNCRTIIFNLISLRCYLFWQKLGFSLHLDKERVYYGEHVLINLVSSVRSPLYYF